MHRLLDRPDVYRLSQRLLAPGASRRLDALLRRHLPPDTGRGGASPRALDVGSGPDSLLARLGLDPVGVDLSPRYARALARHGAAVAADARRLPFADGAFELVACCGLLHHLPDADVDAALAEMLRVAAPSGLVLVLDAVLPEPRWRRPIAWSLRRLDRGRWMRDARALEARLARAGADWRTVRETYAATGLECLLAIARRA